MRPRTCASRSAKRVLSPAPKTKPQPETAARRSGRRARAARRRRLRNRRCRTMSAARFATGSATRGPRVPRKAPTSTASASRSAFGRAIRSRSANTLVVLLWRGVDRAASSRSPAAAATAVSSVWRLRTSATDLEHAERAGGRRPVPDLELGVGARIRGHEHEDAGSRSSSSVIACTSSGLDELETGRAGERRGRPGVTGSSCLPPPTGSVQATVQPISAEVGQHACRARRRAPARPSARGVALGGRGRPGRRCDGDAMRQPDPGAGVCDDLGIGREVPRCRRRRGSRASAVEVALHGLVHALGQREVGDGVVDVEHRSAPARRSRPPRRRSRRAGRRGRTDTSRRPPFGCGRPACGRRARCAPRSPRSARPAASASPRASRRRAGTPCAAG